MAEATHIPVRASSRLNATPERVYDALLDPTRAGRFMFATDTGEMERVEIEPRVGGAYTFVERRPDGTVSHVGEFLELDRPRRLAFSLSVDEEPSERVTIDIAALETGCEVTIVHYISTEWAEHAESARSGWSGILENLAQTMG
jgi:uncharacterized protein YndB with AHSA1/START domain